MLTSVTKTSYSEMTLPEFLAKKGVTEGKWGTKSYRSISWSASQPTAWEERAATSIDGGTVVFRSVAKLLVCCVETTFEAEPEVF